MRSKKNDVGGGDDIDPLIVVFESSCQETFQFSWVLSEEGFVDGMDVIQTADSAAGPWYDYITVVPDAAQLLAGIATVRINNSFEGQRSFRLVRNGQVLLGPATPGASLVEMPTNIAVSNTVESPYGLFMTGPFVRPVSSIENSLINPTSIYVEVTDRLEYFRDITWDGLPTTVSLTTPPGTMAKWTRDGTDPTLAMTWPPPVYEGASFNARVYYPDFALAIRARCFSGECKSPIVIVLVDVLHQTFEMVKTTGSAASVAGSCDLPRTIDGIEYESGLSCNLYHSGTGGFRNEMEQFACAHAAGPAGISGAGSHTIYRFNSASSVGVSWGGGGAGWPAYLYQTSKFFMGDAIPSGYRDVAYWDHAPIVYEYAITHYSGLFKSVTTGPGFTTVPLAGVGGTIADLAHQLGAYLAAFVLGCEGLNGTASFTDFQVLRSLQNDEAFLGPPEPPTNPTPPVEPVIPGDDFESYVDSDHAELLVLNGGIGWALPWKLYPAAILIGEDDMQFYSDGHIIDSVDSDPLIDPIFNAGGGWDGPWRFATDDRNVIGGDDFESYTDGTVILGSLNLGSRWDTDSFWWINPGMELGGDDFQSYPDGAVVDLSLNLGDRWIGSGWKIN